jgi:sugar lactone lactonase YvrE
MIYDAEGQFLRTIGDDETLIRPSDVAVSPDGARVYVVDVGGVDSDQHRVQVFDAASGGLLKTIGTRGSEQGQFNLPVQATVSTDGTLYVVDKGNFRVQAFRPDGDFAFAFGTAGRFPGQFFSPKGIATDNDGNVYVIDTAFGNFQIFNSAGELLLIIGDRGESGAPANYLLPAGIDVDTDGRIYVVDQFFRKIDIFRPVGLKPEEGYGYLPPLSGP